MGELLGGFAVAEGFIEVRDLWVSYGGDPVVKGVSFTIPRGQQLSLLGPSGCGKTTTLRCIAGLETPLSGEILIDGETVYSSTRGINVATEKRQLSLMFQSYAIWPHMTVRQNVAYALKVRRTDRREIDRRVSQVLAMVGMDGYADVKATQLSGGQQQRVALARSYAFPPKALLLDEPLSNLDARLRVQMREDLKRLQRESGITTVYVTHDQEEAMALSDRIIVMRNGVIEQDAPPMEVFERPRTRFVADFIGAANILSAAESADGALVVGDAHVRHAPHPDGPPVAAGAGRTAAIRTVYPQLTRERPADAVNVWPATIARCTLLGDFVEMAVRWPGGELRVKGLPTTIFTEGEEVYLRLPPEKVVVLDEGPVPSEELAVKGAAV
jgi:ABC-type Fe3+/spermidine/putrescine transport system ATPase subunit